MTVKSAPYYWVECDRCGTRADYDDYSAWSDAGQAVDVALDGEWSKSGHGDKHHCPDCPPFCEKCGEDAGELAGERDYLCQSCWDKAEAAEAATTA